MLRLFRKVIIKFFSTIGIFSFGLLLFARDDLIPRSTFFGNPERLYPMISPKGTHLAYIAPYNGVLNIWVRDFKTKEDRVLTKEKEREIKSFGWALDNKHIIYMRDKYGNENWNIYSVDITKKNPLPVNLTPFKDVSAFILSFSIEKPSELLIMMNKENRKSNDTYRLNLATGDINLVQRNPGNVNYWEADRSLDVLGAVTVLPNGGGSLMYRKDTEASWKEILAWGPDSAVKSYGLSKDANNWYLAHNIKSDLMNFIKKDLTTGREMVLYESKKADCGSVLFREVDKEPIAIWEEYLDMKWIPLDTEYEKDIKKLNNYREGNYWIESADLKDKSWLVSYSSSNKPIYYCLYDRTTGKIELLFSHRPKWENLKLPASKPVTIPTRDGLEMVCYLTLPIAMENGKAPLIIYLPPSAWWRHRGAIDTIVEWLANRGYAVLQINPRGTMGFGKKFTNAGNKEWGGKIINDVEDAVDWAKDAGFVKENNVGIFGASLGGYTALAAVTFSKVKFKTCVAYSPPVNLLSYINNIPPQYIEYKYYMNKAIGDSKKNYDTIKKISPYYNIDNINTPCLIAGGKKDILVSSTELYQLAKALSNKKNISVMYIEFPDEGHYYPRNPVSLITFFAAAERFLADTLGGRYEPPSADEKAVLKKTIRISK